jgi:hypothetical protein
MKVAAVSAVLCLSIVAGGVLADEVAVVPFQAADSSVLSFTSEAHRPTDHPEPIPWFDPDQGSLPSYQEWKAGRAATVPLQYEHVHSEYPLVDVETSPRVAVMVNAALWDSLGTSLELYALDLAGEGFRVDIYAVSGGTPGELRGLLQGLYATGLEGAVLVGDLPIAWYEMYGCYDPPFQDEFPVDIFYMDMDGVFWDTDADGLFDVHTGDRAPDIWVGRLTASPLTAGGSSEVELLENYFRKNHLYRCDLAPLAHRGLAYLDDDCVNLTHHLRILINEFMGGCTAVDEPWTTWDTDYEARLTVPYELVQIYAHSDPWTHAFMNPADQWSFTESWEIPAIDPSVYFYILCACSIARHTAPDYMAGWYVFSQSHGLAAIGCTNWGHMLYIHDFYPWLGAQMPLGEAYLNWFSAQAAGGFWRWEECRYYGLILVGDPTLRTQEKSSSRMIQYDNEWGGSSVCLPNDYGLDLFNTRFTAQKECALSAVLMLANPWSGAPTCRVYIWNSDGTFPSDKIDSIDVQLDPANIGRWTWVDVSELGLQFSEGEDFHVGFTTVNMQPGERVDMHSGVRVDSLPMRSSLMHNGAWVLFDDLDPQGHNFDIRVVVVEEPEPRVTITTLTIPGTAPGQPYSCMLDAAGGIEPYSWDLTAGQLPDSFVLDGPTGVISGPPTAAETTHFTVRVRDNSAPPLSDIQHLTLQPSCCNGDGIRGNVDDLVGPAGEVDAADLTYLVAYLFQGGPMPPCEGEGNVDAVGGPGGPIDVADLTYLVAYLFLGGPDPAACP